MYPKDLRRHVETHERSRSASVASSSSDLDATTDKSDQFALTPHQLERTTAEKAISIPDVAQGALAQADDIPELR